MSTPKAGAIDLNALTAQAAFAAEQARIAKLPHKSVNGVLVALTDQEIAAIRAEWAEADAEAAKPKPPTLVDRIASLETDVAALKAARATK